MGIIPISAMKHLSARLGKHKTNVIRYHELANNSKQACATNIPNTVQKRMQLKNPSDVHCPIADLIVGTACSFIMGNKPMSVTSFYQIFQCIELINTREVKKLLGIGDRQARQYVRAVKHILPFLERELII